MAKEHAEYLRQKRESERARIERMRQEDPEAYAKRKERRKATRRTVSDETPEMRERRLETLRRWREKQRQDPEARAKHEINQRKWARKHQEQLRQDPDARAANIQSQRECKRSWYEELTQDPIKYEQYLESQKQKYHERRAKSELARIAQELERRARGEPPTPPPTPVAKKPRPRNPIRRNPIEPNSSELCPFCSKPLEEGRKYCNNECLYAYHNQKRQEKRHAKIDTRHCLICGEVLPPHRARVTCPGECRRVYLREYEKEGRERKKRLLSVEPQQPSPDLPTTEGVSSNV